MAEINDNKISDNDLNEVTGGADEGGKKPAPKFPEGTRVYFKSTEDGSTVYAKVVSASYLFGSYMYMLECDRLYKGSMMARVTEAKIFAC